VAGSVEESCYATGVDVWGGWQATRSNNRSEGKIKGRRWGEAMPDSKSEKPKKRGMKKHDCAYMWLDRKQPKTVFVGCPWMKGKRGRSAKWPGPGASTLEKREQRQPTRGIIVKSLGTGKKKV